MPCLAPEHAMLKPGSAKIAWERDTDCLKGQANRHVSFTGKEEFILLAVDGAKFGGLFLFSLLVCFFCLFVCFFNYILGKCAIHLCLYNKHSKKSDAEKCLPHLPSHLTVPKPLSPLSATWALFQPLTLDVYSVLSQKPASRASSLFPSPNVAVDCW